MTEQAQWHTYELRAVGVSAVSDGSIATPVKDGLILNTSAHDTVLTTGGGSAKRVGDDALAPVILGSSLSHCLTDAGLPTLGAATTGAMAGLLVRNMEANSIDPHDSM